MNRKFQFVDFKSPINLTLTEAKRIIGNALIGRMEVGVSHRFQGYGNGINFTIKRMK